jgi:hypothetical protein
MKQGMKGQTKAQIQGDFTHTHIWVTFDEKVLNLAHFRDRVKWGMKQGMKYQTKAQIQGDFTHIYLYVRVNPFAYPKFVQNPNRNFNLCTE